MLNSTSTHVFFTPLPSFLPSPFHNTIFFPSCFPLSTIMPPPCPCISFQDSVSLCDFLKHIELYTNLYSAVPCFQFAFQHIVVIIIIGQLQICCVISLFQNILLSTYVSTIQQTKLTLLFSFFSQRIFIIYFVFVHLFLGIITDLDVIN